MAEKMNFTQESLAAIVCPPSGDARKSARVWVYDKVVPGLAFCVTEGGARAFYLYRKINGKPVRIRIGEPHEFTVKAARARAGELNSQIAKGDNPQADKVAARSAATLADLWAVYLEKYATPHKKASSVEEDKRNWKNHLECWSARRLSEITPADVKTLHTRIGAKAGHYAANRVLALLSGMFSKVGEDLGIDRRDNPARGVERFREKARDRVLTTEEIGKLLAAVEAEEETIRDLIKVALFTGARRSNVCAMRWEDLNLKQGTWKVPGEVTKNGDPLVIQLAPAVVDILNARPDHSPWVFPAMRVTQEQVNEARRLHSEGETTREVGAAVRLSQTQVCRVLQADYVVQEATHVHPPKTAWENILERAGIAERTTLHDLRRTFATKLVEQGAPLPVVAAAMGHKDIRTTQKHYAMVDAETQRKATLAGVAAIAGAASLATTHRAREAG